MRMHMHKFLPCRFLSPPPLFFFYFSFPAFSSPPSSSYRLYPTIQTFFVQLEVPVVANDEKGCRTRERLERKKLKEWESKREERSICISLTNTTGCRQERTPERVENSLFSYVSKCYSKLFVRMRKEKKKRKVDIFQKSSRFRKKTFCFPVNMLSSSRFNNDFHRIGVGLVLRPLCYFRFVV